MTLKIFVSEQSSTVNFNLIESNNMEQRKYLQSYNLECTFEPNNIEDPYSNIFIKVSIFGNFPSALSVLSIVTPVYRPPLNLPLKPS